MTRHSQNKKRREKDRERERSISPSSVQETTAFALSLLIQTQECCQQSASVRQVSINPLSASKKNLSLPCVKNHIGNDKAESKREREEESDGSCQGRRPCEATCGGERCTRLRVVEAAAAAAPPSQGLVVGVVVAVRGRMVGRPDAVGPGRKSRDLDRRARVALIAPIVAARRRRAQPDLLLHQHSLSMECHHRRSTLDNFRQRTVRKQERRIPQERTAATYPSRKQGGDQEVLT